MAVDLVEYESSSNKTKCIVSEIDHLTRFLVLLAISDKPATTRFLVECVFSDSLPLKLPGTEFDNALVKQLQPVFVFKKTCTATYRSQGNSILQRVHNTTHHTLAMYVDVSYDN